MQLENHNLDSKKIQFKRVKKADTERNFLINYKIITGLEIIQDFIIILLCFGLFGIMFIEIKDLFTSLITPLNFEAITPDIFFILILVEIFRLLSIYLQEKEISVAVAVEIAIVSILREIILRGIMEIPELHIWAICGILLVLGTITIIPSIQTIVSNAIAPRTNQILANSRVNQSAYNGLTLISSNPHNNKLTNRESLKQNKVPSFE